MSSTAGIRRAEQPPSGQGQAAGLGLVSATGLVMSTIVGVGVSGMFALDPKTAAHTNATATSEAES